MEALALSSNIIAVLSLAGKLLAAGYQYGSSSAQFPPEVRHLVQEVTALSGVLHAVKILVGDPATNTGTGSGGPGDLVRTMGETVEQCRKLMEGMLRDLQRYDVASRRRGAWRLCWPLKEKATKEWCERLERHKSMFEVALSVDEVSLAREIQNDVEDIKAIQLLNTRDKNQVVHSAMKKRIRDWLSPADPRSNHLAARNLCQYGTGSWFTEGKEFENWLKADKSFLWLYGIPGAGKTILSSTVIEHVSAKFAKEHGSILAYFYCDFKQVSKQNATNLMGSIIWQISNQEPTVFQDVRDFSAGSAVGPPKLSGLINLLRQILTRISKLAIVVDALDECEDSLQPVMLETLRELSGISSVNLLVVSRDYLNIKLHFEGLPSLGIQKKDVAKDIELYISREIERSEKLKRLSSSIKGQIVDALVKGALGMFRWARCCLDQIRKLRSDKAIKSALESLPPTLDETYERILCNIADEDRELALTVFRFLVCGDRDLTLSEIREGLATEIGSKRMDPDNRLNDEEDILDICGGLVDRNEGNIAGLAHFSVKEYLVSPNLAKGKASYYYITGTLGNTELAKIAYTYLLLDDFNAGPCSTVVEFDLRLKEYPLFVYAAQHGWKHVLKYTYGSDKILDALLAQFYSDDNNPNFVSWRQARSSSPEGLTGYLDPKSSSTATLYYASEAGLWQLIKGIIGAGTDVNHSGGRDASPLGAAAKYGHLKTVKVLLEHGANAIRSPGHDPMCIAAGNGHADCVKALIEAGGISDDPDIGPYGASISQAVIGEHEEVFNTILCSEYYTKLENSTHLWLMMYFASEEGFDWAAQMLVEKYGSRIFCDGNEFLLRTLKVIAEHSRIRTLQCILQKKESRALLLRAEIFAPVLEGAVYYGHAKMVELLLRNKIDSLELGVSFHLAIAKGYPMIGKMLLSGGADPCAKDEHGWTPMFYAMQCLKGGTMEWLLTVLGDVEKSEIMNIAGMGPVGWEAIGNSTGLKISEDECEVENVSASEEQLRTKFPITPVVDDYYFEVRILKGSKNCTIGFVDAMYHYVVDGFGLYSSILGQTFRSWGYLTNRIYTQEDVIHESVPPYTTNDIIGCHFDRVRGAVSFTLNGKRAGKPLPGTRGKLRPMIRLAPGDKIRANFGSEPFLHEIPEPAAPEEYKWVRPMRPPLDLWFRHPSELNE